MMIMLMMPNLVLLFLFVFLSLLIYILYIHFGALCTNYHLFLKTTCFAKLNFGSYGIGFLGWTLDEWDTVLIFKDEQYFKDE